jgi:hypothetical protein
MFNGGLVCCSMRLGDPFIAPRQLGAVGAPFGRQFWPFVRGRTGLSGAYRTVNSTSTVRDRESPDWLVSFSVGHRTIWCVIWPLALGRRSMADTPDCQAPRADCPVNYSRRSQENPRAESLADRAPECPVHTGPSGAAQSSTFSSFLSLSSFYSFGLHLVESLALRQVCLSHKTID